MKKLTAFLVNAAILTSIFTTSTVNAEVAKAPVQGVKTTDTIKKEQDVEKQKDTGVYRPEVYTESHKPVFIDGKQVTYPYGVYSFKEELWKVGLSSFLFHIGAKCKYINLGKGAFDLSHDGKNIIIYNGGHAYVDGVKVDGFSPINPVATPLKLLAVLVDFEYTVDNKGVYVTTKTESPK